jgi:hypothetical protein
VATEEAAELLLRGREGKISDVKLLAQTCNPSSRTSRRLRPAPEQAADSPRARAVAVNARWTLQWSDSRT